MTRSATQERSASTELILAEVRNRYRQNFDKVCVTGEACLYYSLAEVKYRYR